MLKKTLVAAGLGTAVVLCATAVLWPPAPQKLAAQADAAKPATALSHLQIGRRVEPPAPSDAARAAPDAGEALPFAVHRRWRQTGATVVALVQSNRVFEARDGEVVAGSYLMTSDSERLMFTRLQTGRVHVIAWSEDCQELREPVPPTVPTVATDTAMLAATAHLSTAPELTDAERDAQED